MPEELKPNRNNKKIGEITSTVYSSKLNAWIGLAYIARKLCQVGNRFITKGDSAVDAEIVELPFV